MLIRTTLNHWTSNNCNWYWNCRALDMLQQAPEWILIHWDSQVHIYNTQIIQTISSVWFVGGGEGLVRGFKAEDDPLTGDCKVWSGGQIPPLRKVKTPNSSLNRYKPMSHIIRTHPQKLSL